MPFGTKGSFIYKKKRKKFQEQKYVLYQLKNVPKSQGSVIQPKLLFQTYQNFSMIFFHFKLCITPALNINLQNIYRKNLNIKKKKYF